MGHEVHILAASFSHLRQKNPNMESDIFSENEGGIHYHYLKTKPYSGNGLGRILNMFTFARKLKNFKYIVEGSQIVLASIPHLIMVAPSRKLARAVGARFVLEVRDIWPLSLIELLGISRFHPFALLMGIMEARAYRNTSLIVSLMPNGREHFQTFGIKAEQVANVPNGFEASDWSNPGDETANPTLQALRSLRAKYDFVVMYLGTIGAANSLEPFLEAKSHLDRDNTAFVLVGNGNEREHLEAQAPPNTFFLNQVPKRLVPACLSYADTLHIGWRDRHNLYKFGISPNKIMDYMMSGKPIVHAVNAWNDPVAESGAGFSVPPGKPEAIAEAITKLMDMPPSERGAMGRRGKEFVINNYEYEHLAKTYISHFEKLLASNGSD